MLKSIERQIISCIVADNSMFVQHRNQLLPDLFANPQYKTIINFFNANITNQITKTAIEFNLKFALDVEANPDLSVFNANLNTLLANYKQNKIELAIAQFYSDSGIVPQVDLTEKFIKQLNDIDTLINNQQCAFTADRDWLLKNAEEILTTETDKIKSGYQSIDNTLEGGFERGNLVTISANTGAGKTTWALNLYLRMIKLKQQGLFFSTEMTEREMAKRIYRTYAERYITAKTKLTHGDLDRIIEEFAITKGHTVIIEPRLTTGIIRREVLQYKRRGLDFIVIDNLNRMQLPNMRNKFDAFAAVVKELKNLALEEDIVIILLAQSTAENMKSSKNKRLTLADLAGSQDISRESNYVFMLHREAYFRQQGGFIGEKIPESIRWITEVSCVKARENNPFNFCVKFSGGALNEVMDIEEIQAYVSGLKE